MATSVGLTLAAPGADYSTYIKLTGPADKARVPYEKPDDVTTLAFTMDINTIYALQTDDDKKCGLLLPQFSVECQGAGCKAGSAAQFAFFPPETVHTYYVRASDLLALTTGGAIDHTFRWGASAMRIYNPAISPPCLTMPVTFATLSFTLVKVVPTPTPTPGPPDLALSLDLDNPAVWPKKVLLADRGGPSKGTFLTISLQTLSATDANVKKYCALLDEHKTHTILEMKHGDSLSFDVPALPLSQAQKQALLPPTPAPTPAKGMAKSTLQPATTFHDSNTHQVVTCQYRIDARLGTDTNKGDSDKQNNALTRTIHVDMPMN